MSKKSVELDGSDAGFSNVWRDAYKTSGDRGDLSFFAPSLTRQEFAEECDINTIMDRYEKSGALSHVNRAQPMYMDCTQFPDLRGAMDVMREAGTAFALLPAKVRREFDNNPQAFVDFARKPENLARMREWGLAPAEKLPEPPAKVEIVNLPKAEGPAGGAPAPAAGPGTITSSM
jgi:phage internal scaffolding protein